ncbi:hypothetical protein EJD97_014390, partial [Solanum chilense]
LKINLHPVVSSSDSVDRCQLVNKMQHCMEILYLEDYYRRDSAEGSVPIPYLSAAIWCQSTLSISFRQGLGHWMMLPHHCEKVVRGPKVEEYCRHEATQERDA